jgi:hypothetical protein
MPNLEVTAPAIQQWSLDQKHQLNPKEIKRINEFLNREKRKLLSSFAPRDLNDENLFLRALAIFQGALNRNSGIIRIDSNFRLAPVLCVYHDVRTANGSPVVAYQLFLNPDLTRHLFSADVSPTHRPDYYYGSMAAALKEGATIDDYQMNPKFYEQLEANLYEFQKQGFNTRDEASRALALRTGRGSIESEAKGYRRVIDYFESQHVTVKMLETWAMDTEDPWLHGLFERLANLLSAVQGKKGPERELALARNILAVDIQVANPILFGALERLTKENPTTLIETPQQISDVRQSKDGLRISRNTSRLTGLFLSVAQLVFLFTAFIRPPNLRAASPRKADSHITVVEAPPIFEEIEPAYERSLVDDERTPEMGLLTREQLKEEKLRREKLTKDKMRDDFELLLGIQNTEVDKSQSNLKVNAILGIRDAIANLLTRPSGLRALMELYIETARDYQTLQSRNKSQIALNDLSDFLMASVLVLTERDVVKISRVSTIQMRNAVAKIAGKHDWKEIQSEPKLLDALWFVAKRSNVNIELRSEVGQAEWQTGNQATAAILFLGKDFSEKDANKAKNVLSDMQKALERYSQKHFRTDIETPEGNAIPDRVQLYRERSNLGKKKLNDRFFPKRKPKSDKTLQKESTSTVAPPKSLHQSS